MNRWIVTVAALLAGCGLYTGDDATTGEPSATSYIDFKDVPVAEWRHPVDLVFVIDTTPDMAPLHDKLVAQLAKLGDFIEAQGVTTDLQIMVTTADPADHGAPVNATALHMLSLPAGGYDRSFAGSLSDELSQLVPASFTATSSQPLDALVTSLTEQPPGDAQLFVVIITNHDDSSPESVDHYVAEISNIARPWPLQPMIGLVDTRASAPRLEQFFNGQVEPYDHANIDDDDWSEVLLSFQIKSVLGLACVDAVLAEPYDCAISAIDGASETVLPSCDAGTTNRPCYSFVPDPASCVFGSGVYEKVSWRAWPEYGTHVISQCVAESPSK